MKIRLLLNTTARKPDAGNQRHGIRGYLAGILLFSLSLAVVPVGAQEPVPALSLEVTGLPAGSGAIPERLQLFLDCTEGEENDNCFQGLKGPSTAFGGIALSPDGRLLAVLGAGDNALSLWQVDTASDTISRSALYCSSVGSCPGGTDVEYGLEAPNDLTFSHDGELLMVANLESRSLSVWQVNAEAGTLTRSAVYWDSGTTGRGNCQDVFRDIDQCSARENSDGARIGLVENGGYLADGLNGAFDVAASPTHDLLFITGRSDRALSVWAIDAQAGTLTQIALYKGGSSGATACSGTGFSGANCEDELSGLQGVRGLTVSPDGRLVLVAGSGENALSVWRVNPEASGTAVLTQTDIYEDGANGIDGLGGVQDIAVSPNGRLAFATGTDENALSVWRVNAAAGTLTQTALYWDINAENCTDAEEAQGNCFDGLTSVRNLTLSPDGRLLFVTAVTDDSLSAFEVDDSSSTLRQTALSRIRSNVLVGLNTAADVIFGPLSAPDAAVGLGNPAGVVVSAAGTVFLKAGAGTAVGALSTWRVTPLVPTYSSVVLTVETDRVLSTPTTAAVKLISRRDMRELLLPVTLSSASVEATIPAGMLTPGLWDITVQTEPGAADVTGAQGLLRVAPLSLRLQREQQGDQVNLRATTTEGPPIAAITVTVQVTDTDVSTAVTFTLTPENFQDVLVPFPAGALPSGRYSVSLTSSPTGTINTVSTRAALMVRDYTLSLEAPAETLTANEFSVTVSAAPSLETTLRVTVTLRNDGVALQTRLAILTAATPSQAVAFTAPDASSPITVMLDTETMAEDESVTVVEASIANVLILPLPAVRLVFSENTARIGMDVSVNGVRIMVDSMPLTAAIVTVKATLRNSRQTSITASVEVGPDNFENLRAMFSVVGVPAGLWDLSASSSPPNALDTTGFTGTLRLNALPFLVLPEDNMPAGRSLKVSLRTVLLVTEEFRLSAIRQGSSPEVRIEADTPITFTNTDAGTATFAAGLDSGVWRFRLSPRPGENFVEIFSSGFPMLTVSQRLLTLTPTQEGAQVQVHLAAIGGAPATPVTAMVVAEGGATSRTLEITLGPDAAESVSAFPPGVLPPGVYDFSVVSLLPPDIAMIDNETGTTTLTVVSGLSFMLPTGSTLPAGSTVMVTVIRNSLGSALLDIDAYTGDGDIEDSTIVSANEVVSFPEDMLTGMAVFSAGSLLPNIWRFRSSNDLNIGSNDRVTALTIEDRVQVTLTPDASAVSAGGAVRLVATAVPSLAESLGRVLITVTATGSSGLASGQSEEQMVTLSSELNAEPVIFPRLASGVWMINGTDARNAVTIPETEVTVVLSAVIFESTASLTDIDGAMRRAVAVGSDVRLGLTADPAPGTSVTVTVSAVDGDTGETTTTEVMLSSSAPAAEALFSGANALGVGTWGFTAVANPTDTVVFQAAPMVVVLVPTIILTSDSDGETVRVTQPVRLTVASMPFAPGMPVEISVLASLGDRESTQMVTLSPEMSSASVEFTPDVLGRVVGDWTFTATAEPEGLADVSGAAVTVPVGLPAVLLTPVGTSLDTGSSVVLTVSTDAPIEGEVSITVTGMSEAGPLPPMAVVLSPGDTEETVDFGVLPEGEYTFTATSTPTGTVETVFSTVTVIIAPGGNLLDSLSLTPRQIVQGTVAILRVEKVRSADSAQTVTVLRDGVPEGDLVIPADSPSAEAMVRGDGIGAYTYSLGDPNSELANEEEERFRQPLRVVADVQLSFGLSFGYVGQSVGIRAALVDADGSAESLDTSVTLTLRAEEETSGMVLDDISLTIPATTISGSAVFLPSIATTWTITVSEISPPDALLVPAVSIAPAAIAIREPLQLVLMPTISSVLIGSPIELMITAGNAADVEVTALTVRAVRGENGRSDSLSLPTENEVTVQLDSLSLPTNVVFRAGDLGIGEWQFELIAEPAFAISVSAPATVTLLDANLDLSLPDGDGVGADDLILLLRYQILCVRRVRPEFDCADGRNLTRNLSAADYDLPRLVDLRVPDVASDGIDRVRADIFILMSYLQGVEGEEIFPPFVAQEGRAGLLRVVRHLLDRGQ